MQISLQLFGAFRPFGNALTLTLPEGAAVHALRPAILREIAAQAELLESSRFATDTEILPENAPLADGMVLAILPPVSGG